MDLPKGGVLALDLSGTTGWAYELEDAALPLFGRWFLPNVGGEGMRYAAFENEMARFMVDQQPSHVILEAPISLGSFAGDNNARSVNQQRGLRAIAYSECYRASCSITEIGVMTVRDAVIGHRIAKGESKRTVMQWAKLIGLPVVDDNQADACAVWIWRQAQMRRSRAVGGRGRRGVDPTARGSL